MNKKGFTLVELLLVVVIIGIIGVVTIPNIMEALSQSKAEGGESIEKLLEKNLELYNKDNEEDLWSINQETKTCEEPNTIEVKISDLYNTNPDIDMGNCLINDQDPDDIDLKKAGLTITRICTTEEGNLEKPIKISYKYSAKIICSNDFDSTENKIATPEDLENENIYYKTVEN